MSSNSTNGKNKSKKIVIILMIIAIILVIAIGLVLIYMLQANTNLSDPRRDDIEKYREKIETKVIQDPILDGHDPDVKYDVYKTYSSYIETAKDFNIVIRKRYENPYRLTVRFPKDLFDNEGNSHQEYFEGVVKYFSSYIPVDEYVMDDPEKAIKFTITKKNGNDISYKINGIENYFSKFNFGKYKAAKETEICRDSLDLGIPVGLLYNLNNQNFKVTRDLGSAEYKQGEYIYYLDNSVKVKSRDARIHNLVFLENYKDEVFDRVKMNDSLMYVHNTYPNNAFGSIADGYLGYRNNDFYFFVYDDEISVYGYGYQKNSNLEDWIDEYFDNNNLEDFHYNLTSNYNLYDEYEYDAQKKDLHITYPWFGINIDIRAGKDVKIDLYSNYKFTERTAKLVGEGRANLHDTEDTLLSYETKRRENESLEYKSERIDYKTTNKENEEENNEEKVDTIVIN